MKRIFQLNVIAYPTLFTVLLTLTVAIPPIYAQSTLKGRVTDGTDPLIGVTVLVMKDTVLYKAANTAYNGVYVIGVDTGTYNLKFLYTGMTPYYASGIQVQSYETVTLDVVMAAKTGLSETVVVGYGTLGKKKRHEPAKKPYNQKVISNIPKTPANAPRSEQPQLVIAFEPETYEEKMVWVYSDGSPAPSPDSIGPEYSGEQYDPILENPFQKTTQSNVSTFSIDVDAASYANIRRFLADDELPPPDAVRIEEMINYFDYDYPQPAGAHPFEINTEVAPCPWNPEHKLMLIGMQGQKIDLGQLPSANLVFLIDVSGSMDEENKLPLVIESLNMLTDQLRSNDKVAIVVYAGAAGLVLKSTPGHDKKSIKDALSKLNAGGSTAGGAGIQLAYQTARNNFIAGGNNRVILCTDGDFNVGVSNEQDLIHLIEKERADGIYLTVLGFGEGNYQDGKMQSLADKGNGNHAYIDGLKEAKKVLVEEFGGTVFAVAKDVKLQLHFNPTLLEGYRLIGYENRVLAAEDFHDDTKDAGELGVGHRVTALYELVPAGKQLPPLSKIDSALVVVEKPDTQVNVKPSDLMVLQLRYKKPQGDQPSKLMEYRLNAAALDRSTMSDNFKLASAVAEFGLLLRNSKFRGNASFARARARASEAVGRDADGHRLELLNLIQKASEMYSSK